MNDTKRLGKQQHGCHMAIAKRGSTDSSNTAFDDWNFHRLGETFNGSTANDVRYGTTGNDRLYGNAGHDLLVGNSGNDFLDGGAGDDTLEGGDGSDEIYGGANVDTVNGGNGNDVIDGGAGRDWLAGGAGNDVIRGGAGVDTLTGGAGADTFLFLTGDIDPNANSFQNRDHVRDFESGVDTVDLRALAALVPDGALFIDDNDGVAFEAGEIHILSGSGNGTSTLLIDLEGDGETDFSIGFDQSVPLAKDIVLA